MCIVHSSRRTKSDSLANAPIKNTKLEWNLNERNIKHNIIHMLHIRHCTSERKKRNAFASKPQS